MFPGSRGDRLTVQAAVYVHTLHFARACLLVRFALCLHKRKLTKDGMWRGLVKVDSKKKIDGVEISTSAVSLGVSFMLPKPEFQGFLSSMFLVPAVRFVSRALHISW